MKKINLLLYCLLLTQCIFAQKKTVVATASIFADMAQNIAGDQLEVKMVVPIGGDPHIYEPIPQDAQLIANADLILKNGLTFEGWLNELIENSGTKAQVVQITEGVEIIESLTYENSADPHAWMTAKNGLVYIENIKNALAELDPDNADIYEFNYGIYKQQLEDLDKKILADVQTIPEERRILITSHDAFQYYGRYYGIRLEAILGTSTDADAQTSDINRLHQVIKKNKVPALFVESTINPKNLQQIAKDTDVVIGGQLYADSLGDEKSPASTYLDMLKHNTETIVKGLTREVISTHHTDATAPSIPNFWRFIIIGGLVLIGFIVLIKKLA